MTTGIIHWLGYSLTLVAVLGIVGQTARIAWTHGNPGDGVGWTLLGLAIVGAAAAIIGTLT